MKVESDSALQHVQWSPRTVSVYTDSGYTADAFSSSGGTVRELSDR